MRPRVLLGNNAQFIRRPFGEFLDAAAEAKIAHVELTLQTPHFYVDSDGHGSLEKQKEALKDRDIRVKSVVPLPYRYSICAEKETWQHEKTLGYYKQCILTAEELGAEYVCVTASGANFDEPREKLMERGIATLRVLADFAGQHGVILLLSSVLGELCPVQASTPVMVHLDEIKAVVEAVNSPSLQVYLDTEVISVCGETIPQWFAALGEQIRLIRFADGNYNGYRVWGRGCLPCSQFLRQVDEAGYDGAFSLTVPGERYVDDPAEAFGENIRAVREKMRQE